MHINKKINVSLDTCHLKRLLKLKRHFRIHSTSRLLSRLLTNACRDLQKDKRKRRRSLPKRVRDAVWDKYIGQHNTSGVCLVCRDQITLRNWECAHIRSVANNGTDTVDNLVPCCHSCNKSMGTQNLWAFQRQYFDKLATTTSAISSEKKRLYYAVGLSPFFETNKNKLEKLLD